MQFWQLAKLKKLPLAIKTIQGRKDRKQRLRPATTSTGIPQRCLNCNWTKEGKCTIYESFREGCTIVQVDANGNVVR